MKLATERSSKFSVEILGPFTIVTKLHGNKFKIMDNATHATEVAHADRLAEQYTWMAQVDLQLYALANIATCLSYLFETTVRDSAVT